MNYHTKHTLRLLFKHGVMQGLLKQSDVSEAAKKYWSDTSGLYGQEEIILDSFEAGVWWACDKLSSSPTVGNSADGQSGREGVNGGQIRDLDIYQDLIEP